MRKTDLQLSFWLSIFGSYSDENPILRQHDQHETFSKYEIMNHKCNGRSSVEL